jgi:hypothetical protein
MDVTNPSVDEGVQTPAPPEPSIRREQLGRFRLLEKLGRGGMGEVYRAVDTSDGTIVAIKTLLPEFARKPDALRRFKKEARLLEEANNPYVANLLEMNEDGGIHYLAVEFVAGQSVSKRMEAGKPLKSLLLSPLSAMFAGPLSMPTPAASFTATSSRRTSCCWPAPMKQPPWAADRSPSYRISVWPAT